MQGQGRGSDYLGQPGYSSYHDAQVWSSQQQQDWSEAPPAYPQRSHTVRYSSTQPGYNTASFANYSGQAGSYAQQGTSGVYGHSSQQYPQGYSGNPNAQQQRSGGSSGYGAQPPPHPDSHDIHVYVPLPSTPQSTIDTYIRIVRLPEDEASPSATSRSLRAYQCTVQGCEKTAQGESFKSKDNARVHIHKHFGSDKLFQCAVPTCKKTFASEDAAKRHRDTTDNRAFPCITCGSVFARKDYRDWHYARCAPPRS